MLKQITLYSRHYGFMDIKNETTQVNPWYFCQNQVQKHFDLPKRIITITFTAYKNYGKNRVKVELNDNIITIDNERHSYWQDTTEVAILMLIQKYGTFYVSCEYEYY